MSTRASMPSLEEGQRIKADLLGAVEHRLRAGHDADVPCLARAEREVPPLDPLDWLVAQEAASRGFWSDRERSFELAGIGRADTITGDETTQDVDLLRRLHDRIAEAEGDVRYFCGLRFSASGRRGKEWNAFGAYRFVLPRVEVVRRHGAAVLAVNFRSDEPLEHVADAVMRLRFPGRMGPCSPAYPAHEEDLPGRTDWIATVDHTLARLREGAFDKVVLARRRSFRFDRPPDAVVLLRALRATTSSCFHFCFQPREGQAWFGASPERLYRREGREIRTEAIAGTARRSSEPAEDERFARTMLASLKERREQSLVVEGIQRALAPYCGDLAAEPEPEVLKLRRNQHLVTRFRGTLRASVTDADLLAALHPTPAVGGCPNDIAERYIEEHEPFDRGWFAGPVGWVAQDAAQFAVGIRSGLVENENLHAYAGAGILSASDPHSEWEETEQKMGDLLSLFARHT